jgi:hypothetical protein
MGCASPDVVTIFERVRDIPFKFAPHHDAETLLQCGYGTCAPKHALLAQLYQRLGLETRFVYVTFRFEEMPGEFPEDLRPLLYDGVVRGHTALQLRLNGRWVDVDATFDRPLKTAGFVVTEEWDGRSSMPLVVHPLTRVESEEPPACEETLLGIRHRTRLSRNSVERINGWLDQLRLIQKEARRVAPV